VPSIILKMGAQAHREMRAHLLPPGSDFEEAAFMFVSATGTGDQIVFEPVETLLVGPDGFAVRSPQFLELRDEVRAQVIRRAHGLGASIIEFHSHPLFNPEFSWSDRMGLQEFVPHVRWRLKGAPYGAIVVAPTGFDALFWVGESREPQAMAFLEVEGQPRRPTGLSLKNWETIDE